MAAGSSSKASVGALEASLDRKLQSVTNTMESIQSLSTWCIENKKQHATIVHYWMKWFRRSGFSHRLNLFYLANDIIQNCKRRNAVVYRDSFADVLPEAATLARDPSVAKSVERIFKIWEERNVYPEETILSFKSALSGSSNKRDRSKSSRPKPEKPPEAPAVNPKAALKSKIVAEFRPQSLIDDMLAYKRTVDHTEFKEKQLSSMRVDVCSTETLKRLKDKAGGKKFSKDFEEASSKLEEFVSLLDKQVKNGPSITEALENAAIFYEAQYREVKVVVNAYKTFANRVNNLKKKLDQLKATLPDPEESPVPSPTIDAPSPTGSESPFQGMGDESPLSPEVEPAPSDSPEPPKDNRIVEDMELSEEDADEEMPTIIVEEGKDVSKSPTPSLNDAAVTSASTNASDVAASAPASVSVPALATVSAPTLATTSSINQTTSSVTTTPSKSVTTPVLTPSIPLALPNLANVDLGKISSILSSLTSAMKTTGVSPGAKLSPGTPTTPNTNLVGAIKPQIQTTPSPLANILSKVEITPESILSALSKTQVSSTPNLQGLSSLIQSVAGSTSLSSGSTTLSTTTATANPALQALKDRVTPSVSPFVSKNFGFSPPDLTPDASLAPATKLSAPHISNVTQAVSAVSFSPQMPAAAEKTLSKPAEIPKSEETEPSSLEMKIHNFLKGNPGFSGLDLNIPILSGLGSSSVPETSSEFNSGPTTSTSLDNIDGTPVRDERSGTPTQDEIMDKPASSNVDSVSLLSKIMSSGSSTPSSSRSPLLSKDSDYSKLPHMPYRPFGLGESSPNPYLSSSDQMEKPVVAESSLDKFFPETSFHEDEDYREFDFTGPSPSTIGNLEKMQSKAILQPNLHLNPMEYPPVTQGYKPIPDFSMQPFPPSVQPPFVSGEKSGPSPPPDRYSGYNRRGNLESARSPSPPKDDTLYPSDTNHNIPLLHSSMSQNKYTDSNLVQNRHSDFLPKNMPAVRPPMTSTEQSGTNIAVSTTIEFKNMLKNASRRPCEEKPFGQSSLDEDIRISTRGHAGRTSEVQSEEQYHIETRVSTSSLDLPDSTEEKGAPIETLGYHNMGNMRMSGEPIKTVESMRVGMKGGRGHGMDEGRADWFDIGSTESPFDDGTPNVDEQPSVSGSNNVGFKTQYDEHVTRFPDSVSDFRANNIPPFDRLLPPPGMAPTLDRGGPFQMDQTGPPPGPPPVLPPDPGSLFGREIPVAPQMPPMELPKSLPHVAHPPPTDHVSNSFPIHHAAEHGGMPFSPPPRLDMRNPFSQDHGAIHPGMMQEPYSMHSGSARDQGPVSHDYSSQHNQHHSRLNEPMTMSSHPRDHHGNFSSSQQPMGSHRDFMNTGGLRPHRPHFRPREPYHNLKRPRPPFGRGQQFFSPKRPYYPPRY